MEYQDLKTLSKKTSVSVFTLRKLVKTGMPHFRVGRKILVDPDEFEAWFQERHRASSETQNLIEQIISDALKKAGADSS